MPGAAAGPVQACQPDQRLPMQLGIQVGPIHDLGLNRAAQGWATEPSATSFQQTRISGTSRRVKTTLAMPESLDALVSMKF